jgi:hypothetical protein
VLRWVDTFSADKLRGIRFLAANPRLGGAVSGGTDGGIAAGLTRLADRLAQHLPAPDAEHRLVLRMALLSINAAVFAAAEAGFSDDEIVRSAHRAARALAREATSPGPD